ncbi:hypothetical protein M408DRAFT_26496 [Serendipita vermifera MAFF 305830]|uniref:Uncharacterized protein n=1 Tax=Serendipita vermifera MAFF 305830 TaxID=933852 RepID=A0A0C2WFC2_SERVB|nr:hypothetical protein M408DRAFT_26496 [Serendipita vermifera MAFF 305830]
MTRSPTRESSAPLQLSVLKTLHLTLVEGEDWMLETFQRWDMPVLAHAELRIEFGVPEPSSLNAFFTHIGKKLIRFCLCLFGDWVTLPDNFWKVMPMLEYLGTSALEYDTYRLSPPRDHPFQRLALWDDGVQMDEARGRAGVLAEMWKTLYTISDAHDWADMARQIEDHVFNLDDPKFEEDSVYHQEVYANDCCKCVSCINFR